MCTPLCIFIIFFFNDTATTEIYTLSLHDALPICLRRTANFRPGFNRRIRVSAGLTLALPKVGRWIWERSNRNPPTDLRQCERDRKSTRLNSSHDQISYAVFCLKKKNNNERLCRKL